jgi:hypothetical protein
MENLSKIEQERQIMLPKVYKDFYNICSRITPGNLIGTDLLNHYSELNEWAAELLEEDGIENFLAPDDLVFMMHQGYMFWYFKADGNPDPIVYGYYEQKLKPDNFGRFSDFIKKHLE